MEKGFFCEVCSQEWTTNQKYKLHFSRPKHLENQAIADSSLKVYYETKMAEWDKQKAILLKDNRETLEQLSNQTSIAMKQNKTIQELEGQLFRYSASNQTEYKSLYSQSQ